MNRAQRIADEGYGNGIVADYAKHPETDHGDTLAKFVAVELECCGKASADRSDLTEAIRLMERAREDLDNVIAALYAARGSLATAGGVS